MTVVQEKNLSVSELMQDLVGISQYYGKQPDIVLAGGGNTSAKTAERLYVKASGISLATIEADGFVGMDRVELDQILTAEYDTDPEKREAKFKSQILNARIYPEKNQRPSVECVLHHLLHATYVVHSHCTWANMITCAKNGKQIAKELFGDDLLWLPYVDPGYVLSKELDTRLKEYKEKTGKDCPPVSLMENHGLIICGEEAEEIDQLTKDVIQKIKDRLGDRFEPAFGAVSLLDESDAEKIIRTVGPVLRGLLAENELLKIVRFENSQDVLELVGGSEGQAIATAGALIPDQIVYCQSFPLWVKIDPAADAGLIITQLKDAIEQHTKDTKYPPQIIIVEGVGLFAVGNDFKQADNARLLYVDQVKIFAGAIRLGGVQYMNDRDREFIEDWEVESYRKKIAAMGASKGRVSDKVAVVTGAAQGFGLEIAQNLAKEGAFVVLTDLNEAGAKAQAEILVEQYGSGKAVGLPINVTEGSSISDALYNVIKEYGGLDIFISNAGVVKAGSVKEQSERDFDFVADVNYKGYFLAVQNVSKVLATQHQAKPDYFSDIIQINSKSGLAGSNRNGAYAGSKFGGIGLTQSFALELVDDGIKVNSICPGNFYDGPLWSDPEKGLFVQYLKSGKVPGAKTVEDVQTFYESKVPLRRGCRTEDVMHAILYLIDQKYETGQAVPVTGGQVMLS